MRPLPRIEVTHRPGWHACVTGFGERRRVEVSHDLLQQAPQEIVQAVIAHEHGHHALHHVEQKLAAALVISVLLGYGIATWSPWLVCATVLIAPLFWNGMVITQEVAADRHALIMEGRSAVYAMLLAMMSRARTKKQQASLIVRMDRAREARA